MQVDNSEATTGLRAPTQSAETRSAKRKKSVGDLPSGPVPKKPVIVQSGNSRDLFKIIETGSIEELKALIATGIDIDARNKHGDTPLIYATSVGKTDIATYLIEACANLNIRNAIGRTALHCAVARGAEKLTRHLVIADADLNIKEKQQRDTPLHLAIAIGHNTLERYLIQAGAPLDIQNKHGKTPRMMLDEKYRVNKDLYNELIALSPDFPPAMCLQNQTRRVIRRSASNRIDSLPLPKPLKAFVRGALEHYAGESLAIVDQSETLHSYRIVFCRISLAYCYSATQTFHHVLLQKQAAKFRLPAISIGFKN